jgi:hypothetical protein
LACQDEFFVNYSFDFTENNEHALDFALHFYRLFRSRWVWTLRVQLILSSQNACQIIARVLAALFPIFAQYVMRFFRRFHRKIAQGQIHDPNKGHKNQHSTTSCKKCGTLTRKVC